MSALRAVPHTREFLADTLTPLGVYQRLSRLSPWRFLFESVTGGEQVSRYSFLGAAPRAVYRLFADCLEEEDQDGRRALPGPPLEALARLTSAIRAEPGPLPFTGGFVGYFGYDLVRLVERLPDRPPDPFHLPLVRLARFDRVVIFDHAHQRLVAVANEIEGQVSRRQADAELDELAELLEGAGESGAVALAGAGSEPAAAAPVVESLVGGSSYQAAVRRAKERITAGDIFQAVLARRWRQRADVSPLALYRALRVINPSPYMVLLEGPGAALVGASPEMLVRLTAGRLETRPIAGTRPRGLDPVQDQQLAEELLADPKERAEHVMLVDLGRNDLGRVARPGTVRVSSFMEIERYSHVMHIVSNVEAELAKGKTGLDALLACFPAGTVSGAPKIRAMEIVDDLETEARGPYAGAVGYLSFTGDLDTCITIRTLLVRDGEVSVTAGAGIVADSDPAAEERETESKAAALLAAVDLARSLEPEPVKG
jgi:anthranilate synthase component 1